MTHHIQTYLGFDVGMKRTGVAIGNSLTKQAAGLVTLKHLTKNKANWQPIDTYIKQYQPSKLIVGIPLTQDGSVQKMTQIAQDFCNHLAQRYQLPVLQVSEYLSSNEAKKQLRYNHEHKNAKRGEVDKRAAQIILQTWLNDAG